MLGDLGLARDDDRIARACEYVFTTQLAVWDPPTMAYDCHATILIDPWRNLDIAMNEFREHMIGSPRGNNPTVVSGVRTVASQEGERTKLRNGNDVRSRSTETGNQRERNL